MSDAWLRRLVVLAISLLVIYQVSVWIYAAFGVAAGVIAAALVTVVSFFSARMAKLGAANSAWFMVPTLLFTIVPLGAKLFTLYTTESTAWSRLIDLMPLLVGFVLPVALLVVVYAELRRRQAPPATPPQTTAPQPRM
jgi:hypothetical protein